MTNRKKTHRQKQSATPRVVIVSIWYYRA